MESSYNLQDADTIFARDCGDGYFFASLVADFYVGSRRFRYTGLGC